MWRVFLSASIAIVLAGCAHGLPRQNYTPIVASAQQAPPAAKETFKQRWLRKFFRDRASN